MRNIFFILICMFYINSCVHNAQENKKLERYNNALLSFTPEQISHFPHDLSSFTKWGYNAFYPGSEKYNNKAGLYFIGISDSAFFKKTVMTLIDKEFKSFSITSNDLIFIGDTINTYSSMEDGYPVPSFDDIKDEFGVGRMRLNSRETIFIIDAKQGVFLDNKDHIKGLKLPEKWKHGYSRGITTDSIEMKLIYWLIVW